MAAHSAIDWKGNILIQLQGRNKKQTQAYVGLIQARESNIAVANFEYKYFLTNKDLAFLANAEDSFDTSPCRR